MDISTSSLLILWGPINSLLYRLDHFGGTIFRTHKDSSLWWIAMTGKGFRKLEMSFIECSTRSRIQSIRNKLEEFTKIFFYFFSLLLVLGLKCMDFHSRMSCATRHCSCLPTSKTFLTPWVSLRSRINSACNRCASVAGTYIRTFTRSASVEIHNVSPKFES